MTEVSDVTSVVRAAAAFERMLRTIATDQQKPISPLMLLHLTSLLGAMLVHRSPYRLEDIEQAIRSVGEVGSDAIEGIHEILVREGVLQA